MAAAVAAAAAAAAAAAVIVAVAVAGAVTIVLEVALVLPVVVLVSEGRSSLEQPRVACNSLQQPGTWKRKQEPLLRYRHEE